MNSFTRRHSTPGIGNALRNQRRIIWACSSCFTWHEPRKPQQCRNCERHEPFVRFDSRIEAVYGAELRLMARAGLINDLVFHPRYVAHVKAIDPGGRDSTISWTPDGAYTKNGVRVVYDVKAKGAPLDPVFMLKKRIFGDALDATIRIVRK